MHLSSIKRPEIEPNAVKRADRVVIHVRDDTRPIHVLPPRTSSMPENADGRGWASRRGDRLRQAADPAGPDRRPRGRPPAPTARSPAFINNLGLGYQFAAAGSLLYRKAKESGAGHDLPTDWFTEDVHP